MNCIKKTRKNIYSSKELNVQLDPVELTPSYRGSPNVTQYFFELDFIFYSEYSIGMLKEKSD